MELESFYIDGHSFVRFGLEHIQVLLFCALFGYWFISRGSSVWDEGQKIKYALRLSAVLMFLQLFKPLIRLVIGNYSHQTDLPFHLCSLMPFAMFYIYSNGSRRWWAIFFFWIMAGTFQALFTPSLTDNLPHYEAFRYWGVHAGVVILALYGYFAMNWRLKPMDILYSGLAMNATALIIYPYNCLTNSNYFYLNAKPPGTTLYTALPEWPWYILSLELVIVILFSLIFFLFQSLPYFKKVIVAMFNLPARRSQS
ncbi:MAG: TIGR02206 family membrane protein [Saprospiraceae bacterium]|nr:TIGR02206 family membrane protein [Saprospiraceae bacterium]